MDLTTTQIEKIMTQDPISSRTFRGVFPVDLLPFELLPRPSSLIANLDPHYEKGSHWIAIHLPQDGMAIYFDSFGFPPTSIEILSFLKRNSPNGFLYNPYQYQSPNSLVCGYWCILAISLLNRGFTLYDIHSIFIPNFGSINDFLLLKYIKLVFNS